MIGAIFTLICQDLVLGIWDTVLDDPRTKDRSVQVELASTYTTDYGQKQLG